MHKTRNHNLVLLHTTLHTITRNYEKRIPTLDFPSGVFFGKLSLQATYWNCCRTNPYGLIPIPTFPNKGRRKLIYFSIIAQTSASLPVLWFLNLISFCVSSGVKSSF